MPMNLKDEILGGESYSLEFKRVPNEEREKYLKTVVAFANGKGGRILFGVANDRTIVGIPNERIFAEMDGIVNSISDACAPKIPVDLGIENIDGKAVIVLDVLAGVHCPYYLKSKGNKDGVYVRVGATTCVADDATRRELAFLSEGRSFDGEPCPGAKIDEKRIKSLCTTMYRIARKNCDTEEERRTVKRVTPQQLEAWGVISKVHGKWVGSNTYALLTGDPAFSIRLKCGLFKGNDKAIFLDRREFDGSVMSLIDEGISYLLAKINMGCYFKGAFRHDRYELPPDEMRELVINAFAHRSYLEHDAPVFLAVYDNRVEITSPGGLPRGQTADRALSGYSKIRNDVLAKALNYMRYIEEWGSGLRRVNRILTEYGIRPVAIDEAAFATRMNVYRVVSGASVHDVDIEGRRKVDEPNEPNCEPNEPNHEPNVFTNTVRIVLAALVRDPSVTIPDLMDACHVSRETVKRAIKTLKESGSIRRKGGTRGVWEVL